VSRRKPSRVPSTFAERVGRMVSVVREHVEPGGVYRMAILHDDRCPALRSRSLADCQCDPWFPPPERVA